MEAFQYKKRKEKEAIEQCSLPFDITKISLKNTEIRLIKKNEAKSIIEEYEYLGCLPRVTKYHFGIFFKIDDKEYIGGAITYSPDYAENLNVWEKYGFKDKLITLSRGVCLWWTPKNSASFFITKTIKWLKINTTYKVLSATVDPSAGEIGIIYQSLNWYYVGLMKGNYSHTNKELKRFSVLIDGKKKSSRSIRQELGTISKEIILQKYPDAIFVSQHRKRRYFYFIGTKIENKLFLKNIEHLLQPYPQKEKDDILISGIIYKITNQINQKIYIGQTTRSLNDRMSEYRREIGNNPIDKAIKKYGFNSFKFEIIDTAENLEELNFKEKIHISTFKSNNREIGYNVLDGGRNSIPGPETREKLSRAHKGKKQNKNWIEKRIHKRGSEEAKKYGRQKTEEEKKHLSDELSGENGYWFGKERSNETKQKISTSKNGTKIKESARLALCKKVYLTNITNNNITEYESIDMASKSTGIKMTTVSYRCKNEYIDKNNVKWSFNV